VEAERFCLVIWEYVKLGRVCVECLMGEGEYLVWGGGMGGVFAEGSCIPCSLCN
jgi:hypothetical protein